MTADRQITLTRHIAAPPEKVWQAWTDPAILPRWFGPAGYSCQTRDIDLREGGLWRFDMIGPDGKVWPNLHRYTAFIQPRRIEFTMFDGATDEEHARVVVTLDPEDAGTRINYLMTFPSAEVRDGAVRFGAIDLGQTTLGKLAAIVEA